MLRLLVGVLLLMHGFVHLRLWLWGIGKTLDPHHSWLISDARSVSIALAVLAGVMLGAAGFMALARQDWWPSVAIAGSLVSAALIVLVFNRWLSLGLAIDALVIALAARDIGR